MLFSPLSENPAIGRNIPYVGSFALFMILSAAVASATSFPGLVVARFFQGFMGSPALATGAASMQDMVSHPSQDVETSLTCISSRTGTCPWLLPAGWALPRSAQLLDLSFQHTWG